MTREEKEQARALTAMQRTIDELVDQNEEILKQLAFQDAELLQLRRAVFGWALESDDDGLFQDKEPGNPEIEPGSPSDEHAEMIRQARELKTIHSGTNAPKTFWDPSFAPPTPFSSNALASTQAALDQDQKENNEGHGLANIPNNVYIFPRGPHVS